MSRDFSCFSHFIPFFHIFILLKMFGFWSFLVFCFFFFFFFIRLFQSISGKFLVIVPYYSLPSEMSWDRLVPLGPSKLPWWAGGCQSLRRQQLLEGCGAHQGQLPIMEMPREGAQSPLGVFRSFHKRRGSSGTSLQDGQAQVKKLFSQGQFTWKGLSQGDEGHQGCLLGDYSKWYAAGLELLG